MGNPVESVASKDRAGAILEETKAQYKKVISHRLVPSFATAALRPMMDRTFVLNQKEFIEIALENTFIPVTAENLEEMQKDANATTAGYITKYKDSKPAIIVKRSYLEIDKHAAQMFPSLLAEELGHSFYRPQRFPLSEIPETEKINLLNIHRTRGVLLNKLSNVLQERGITDKEIALEDIEVVTQGFKNFYVHKESGSEIVLEEMVEETRSAILQTAFEIIRTGIESAPQRSPEYQFHTGTNIISESSFYIRYNAGLTFLSSYFGEGKDLRKGLEKLFGGLYYKNVQEFYDSLTNSQQSSFFIALNLVMQEQEKRKKLPR